VARGPGTDAATAAVTVRLTVAADRRRRSGPPAARPGGPGPGWAPGWPVPSLELARTFDLVKDIININDARFGGRGSQALRHAGRRAPRGAAAAARGSHGHGASDSDRASDSGLTVTTVTAQLEDHRVAARGRTDDVHRPASPPGVCITQVDRATGTPAVTLSTAARPYAAAAGLGGSGPSARARSRPPGLH
jgi:hypothetical protein